MSPLYDAMRDLHRVAVAPHGRPISDHVDLDAVLDAIDNRKACAWCVTGRDGHRALFLSDARAVEYSALHHGLIKELYE